LNAGLAANQKDGDMAVRGAEAARNVLRNTVFPRRGGDRRPPNAADANIQAFADFAKEFVGRRGVDAAAKFLNNTRNSDGPRAMDAREFAAKFYEAARGNVDLLVRNGGGMIYLLAGCLAGKAANEMFTSPLIAGLGPQVKAFVGVLAGMETNVPAISSRMTRAKPGKNPHDAKRS
jgi:hypothetical protein